MEEEKGFLPALTLAPFRTIDPRPPCLPFFIYGGGPPNDVIEWSPGGGRRGRKGGCTSYTALFFL